MDTTDKNITNSQRPIGIFDSGLGGLPVAKSIYESLPTENLIYLGDNAHFPYGPKTLEEVCSYCVDICKWFEDVHNVKAIVIACNTATVASLEKVKQVCNVPVIGVIEPVAHSAYEQSKNNKIGVLATDATIKSDIFTKVFRQIDPDVEVVSVAAPDLVLLAENEAGKLIQDSDLEDKGFLSNMINDKNINLATKYCQPLSRKNVDSVVMGCTHYELLIPLIQKCFESDVKLASAGKAVAEQVKLYLENNALINTENSSNNRIVFYNTGKENTKFSNLAKALFAIENPIIKNLSLN